MTSASIPLPPLRRGPAWPAWGWSLLGVLAVWAVIVAVRPGSPLDPMAQALSLAPFLVLVALGQMLVITLGPGNIDVSVGTVISMASYVSVAVGATAGPVLGLAAGVGSGLAAGMLSVTAILLLRVPPIIATLATSLIVTSATLLLADAARGGADPGLRAFVTAKAFGIPIIAIVVAALTVVVWLALTRDPCRCGRHRRRSERARGRAGGAAGGGRHRHRLRRVRRPGGTRRRPARGLHLAQHRAGQFLHARLDRRRGHRRHASSRAVAPCPRVRGRARSSSCCCRVC
ncbi:MAG: hypothetical protein PGN24_11340 [Microbacterium arborescens]